MATRYYGGFSGGLGGTDIRFNDNSAAVLSAMQNGVEAALIKIGIAAKHNVQQVIIDKGVYDTGELHRTIDYNAREADKAVDIGSPKDYAVFNELGTVKMPARPFVSPGILDNVNEYKNIVADTIADRMR